MTIDLNSTCSCEQLGCKCQLCTENVTNFERIVFLKTIESSDSFFEAASKLGMSTRTLRYKMEALQMEWRGIFEKKSKY